MKFFETELKGAYVVEPELIEDERGLFARAFCEREFSVHGLETRFVQCSISFSRRKGTLRGMHYQAPPHAETKIVRCTSGAVRDVIVDLRRSSPTRGRWFSVELTARNRAILYIPEGVAHGFQTLEDNSEVFYQISKFYKPEATRGVRWNDPAFSIPWPLENPILSERDRTYPDWQPETIF